MVRRPLHQLMAPDWADALSDQAETIARMGDFLRAELAAGHNYLPDGSLTFRAFSCPLREVKVLIVGQDPYPTPGHAIGLSFAVNADIRPLPKSLINIYRELESDMQIPPVEHGDLTGWLNQGVLLLNRCLSVQAGRPGSHRGKGWEEVTDAAIKALIARGGPLVAILWGRDAQSLTPALQAANIPIIASAHPSPLAASRGFFGSRPFSRANAALIAQGGEPIDWDLRNAH